MIKKVHSSWFIVHSVLFFLLPYAICHMLPATCYAQAVSSTDLINNAKQYDGKTVVYAGEVIGDIMVRGGYAWINVKDGRAAIGIWLHKDLTKDIFSTGSYKSMGDWLEIVGVFQRACPQHGGDLDIHAQAVRVIRQGRQTQEKLNLSKSNQAIVLLVILGMIWILTRLKRK